MSEGRLLLAWVVALVSGGAARSDERDGAQDPRTSLSAEPAGRRRVLPESPRAEQRDEWRDEWRVFTSLLPVVAKPPRASRGEGTLRPSTRDQRRRGQQRERPNGGGRRNAAVCNRAVCPPLADLT